jgi:hypothetical protein
MTKRTGDARRKLELKREQLRVLSAADVTAAVGGGWGDGGGTWGGEWEPIDPDREDCGRAYSKCCRLE